MQKAKNGTVQAPEEQQSLLGLESDQIVAASSSDGINVSTRKTSNINTWQIMGELFELDERFRVIEYLGAGAYGVVCAVNDTIGNRSYAIKKCKKVFHSRTLAKRTLREMRLLRLLNCDNIIKVKSVLMPSDPKTFDNIYIIFELMETDLAQIIRSPQRLKDQHIQYFMYQLLVGLQFLHSANIVHRDLKPRNLLVNGDCRLKIADFGLARIYNDQNDTKIIAMTEYVTTRWYRAPEVLVGWRFYTSKIDIWAVGCILAELIGRSPLFPGNDSLRQIKLICQCLGSPDESFIHQSRKSAYRYFLTEMQKIGPLKFADLFPEANPLALEILEKFLQFEPEKRMSAEDALQQGYMASMPKHLKSVNRCERIPPSEFEFEEKRLSVDDLRAELLREVNMYHQKPLLSSEFIRKINDPSTVIEKASIEERKDDMFAQSGSINDLAVEESGQRYPDLQKEEASSHSQPKNQGAVSTVRRQSDAVTVSKESEPSIRNRPSRKISEAAKGAITGIGITGSGEKALEKDPRYNVNASTGNNRLRCDKERFGDHKSEGTNEIQVREGYPSQRPSNTRKNLDNGGDVDGQELDQLPYGPESEAMRSSINQNAVQDTIQNKKQPIERDNKSSGQVNKCTIF